MIKENQKFNESVNENSALLVELREKLPQFFTSDKYDENGKLIEQGAFDFAKFSREMDKENISRELSSGYTMEWTGKQLAKKQAGERSETVIVPDVKHNERPENAKSENLFFTGDNLEVLRHLQTNYQNSVDFIYIDPPYNTGSDGFVYPDKFEYSDEKLKEEFSLNDDELKRLKSIQGRATHSAWLTFMYPRLYLAKKLLKDSGVIFVSIDDNEQANLKLLMDDIFGEGDFIGQFLWNKTSTPPSLSKDIRKKYEYIFSYQKSPARDWGFSSGLTDGGDAPLINGSNKEGVLTFNKEDVEFRFNGSFKSGKYDKVDLLNDIEVINGKSNQNFSLRGKFKWIQETLMSEVQNGTTFVIKTDKFSIRYQRAEKSLKTPSNIINREESNVGTNEEANQEIRNYFNNLEVFNTPKPVSLVKYLLSMNKNKDLVALDFFAGSATTADAVMQLNTEDGGNRKFIMVQLSEPTFFIKEKHKPKPTRAKGEIKLDFKKMQDLDNVSRSFDLNLEGIKYYYLEKKEAFDAGYMTIDEISRKRIELAGEKIKFENPLTTENLDTGFKHYRVVKPNIMTIDKIEEFDPEKELLFSDDMVSPFSSDSLNVAGNASGLDTILTTWLVADGYKFNEPVETLTFANATAHYVAKSTLYIIDSDWSQAATEKLLNQIGTHKLNVNQIFVYEYSLGFTRLTELKTNVKQLSEPNVKVEVRG